MNTDVWHDKQRELLIYRNHPGAPLQMLPEAKVNGAYFAVPRTLYNCQILRYYNYPVVPIITKDNYDFPIEPGKTPTEQQIAMANFDVLHRRAFNLSDPGTMKTLAKLWAADWLMRQYPEGQCRALIVAPLTILETVWLSAIFKTFLNRRTAELLHGPAEKRQALLAKKADFNIINFEGVGVGAHTRKGIVLDGFSLDLLNDDGIKIVIIDEADAYCDAQTKRHRIARQVLGKRENLWLQTGTPTGNAPTDAYGMAKLVNNCFGKSFTTFREETMMKVSTFKWVPRANGYDIARRVLTPAIRFSIEEVWKDAPEMIAMPPRKVALTADQIAALASLKRDLQVEVKSGALINAASEGAARQKFLQIVLGGIYDSAHKTHVIDAKPRYAELEYLIRRAPRKVLIFAGLTNAVHAIEKHLKKCGWKVGVINGEVPQKERTRLIRAFEADPDFKVMVMDPQPTAHGINEFVVANDVIWFGPTEKTRLYIQANRRAHRPGQKFPVRIWQLIATKLEEEIFRRLETNTSLQGALLDSVRQGVF